MSARPRTAEEAIERFLERRRDGEDVDPAAFLGEHAEFEPDLSSALNALLALEHVTRVEEGSIEAAIPERIGAFRVVRAIGHGGMGVVLEAVEERLNRRVALKVLPPELLTSPAARSRFRREAELAARLDHSGIATIYGAGMEDLRPWIAMRFVEGHTLATAIAESREKDFGCVRLDPTSTSGRDDTFAVANLIARVARALQSAHERGVVHRDIKPSNVMVQPDGSPVLLDFGLAFAEETDGRTLTSAGEVPGTPAYLAPETINGEVARPDAQGDVYALGVMLYECLTLQRPFDGPTRVALYRAILAGVPTDPRELNRSVSRDLAVVTLTAIERERGQRYRSALALAEDLEACASGRPVAARPVPLHGRAARWIRREPRQALLTGLLGATAIALALFGGNYWASRDVVHAAERVAREQQREQDLVAGFAALQAADPSSDAAFARVLVLEPDNLEALAGKIIARVKHQPNAALALLEHAPETAGFDALRAYCHRTRVDQDAKALQSPRMSSLDLMLIGQALMLEAHQSNLSQRGALSARALVMMNEAVIRAPTAHTFLHVVRSIAALEAGNERASRSAANALLSLWPDSFEAVFAAGSALSVFDPIAARPILEHATTLNPRSAPPFQVLGLMCTDIGEFEEAERWSWLALDRGHHAETYNALGRSLAMRGCIDEARQSFARAVAVDPTNEHGWENLAMAELQSGNEEAGVFALEHVLELDPTRGLCRGNLGMLRVAAGDLQGARQQLEYAIVVDPARPEWYAGLAEVLIALGEDEALTDVVETGLAAAPGNRALLELRARISATR